MKIKSIAHHIASLSSVSEVKAVIALAERRLWDLQRVERLYRAVDRINQFRLIHADMSRAFCHELDSFDPKHHSFVVGGVCWFFEEHLRFYPAAKDPDRRLVLEISNAARDQAYWFYRHGMHPLVKEPTRLVEFTRAMYNLYYVDMDNVVYDGQTVFIEEGKAPKDLLNW